jgi:Mrp family chromosome partitioning ATPase
MTESRGDGMPQHGEPAQAGARGLEQHLPSGIQCVGVMSGKGGVGKSVVTALLATAFARAGRNVGILDADLTGPSIPRIFGLHRARWTEGERIRPVPSNQLGIAVMSLNLLMEHEDDPVIWRGPLVAKTLEQLVTDVDWSGVEVMFVDLPPGTSDVPLTVMQSLPLTGLVMVSSPQSLAAMIVGKAIKMARMMKVPILGVVENMTHVICPKCGERIALFGRARGEDDFGGLEVLARIPVDPELSALCDQGEIESYVRNPFEGKLGELDALMQSPPGRS